MTDDSRIRVGTREDLEQLLALERACFDTDRLSKRSFLHFLRPGAHDLLVLAQTQRILGYVLLLYRAGTNLARMYSIAVLPSEQGKGLSRQLLAAADQAACAHRCAFMRLEVSVKNAAAISLYRNSGYRDIDTIPEYYDNGDDARRMEKRLIQPGVAAHRPSPYYEQTTEFTCGPAALMMAMKTLKSDYEMTRREELQIWREATTIFMTAGHGGCSPYGLALSAWHRGFDVSLHTNQREAPFVDGVRDQQKKAVIELVHQDFLDQIRETGIRINYNALETAELDQILQSGLPVLALISTWRLNRNKAPHWVYVAGSDDDYVYINDSDVGDDPHATQSDYIQVPIARHMFRDMARFGQRRLRCLLVLSGPRG